MDLIILILLILIIIFFIGNILLSYVLYKKKGKFNFSENNAKLDIINSKIEVLNKRVNLLEEERKK
jgi:flagellar basal body-associated protein FliL